MWYTHTLSLTHTHSLSHTHTLTHTLSHTQKPGFIVDLVWGGYDE